MRPLLITVAFALLSSVASAQLVAVMFKDPKDASKYKANLVNFRGQQCVIGEVYRNVAIDFEKNEITKSRDKPLEFFVADADDPSKIPYKFENDEKVVAIKKQVVSIPEPQVDRIDFFDRSNNLIGLAADYADKKAKIDELAKERDSKTRGSPEWMSTHRRMVIAMEQLHSWLEESLYPEAAKKLSAELTKQRKMIDEAAAARGNAARASVKEVPTPSTLVAAAQKVSNGTDKFKVQESLHARIVYYNGIADARVHELLTFAEDVIEAFRVEFVDPYVDDGYQDNIPEDMVIEWFFGPDDIKRHEQYFTEYYGLNWGDKKAERLEAAGNGARRGMGPTYLHYWRDVENSDLEGIVAHTLGHDLANMHYDKKREGTGQDWLEEGVGYYIAFEWLGRNTVTCKAFAKESVYAHQVKKEGEKSAQEGLRDWYNALALESGPTIDRLAPKSLYEMGDAELAKSWSFFDFIAHKCGKQGQQFLRAACDTARNKTKFIADWRAKSDVIFDVKGQDVFAMIEKRWRDFATAGQETGDAKRKR